MQNSVSKCLMLMNKINLLHMLFDICRHAKLSGWSVAVIRRNNVLSPPTSPPSLPIHYVRRGKLRIMVAEFRGRHRNVCALLRAARRREAVIYCAWPRHRLRKGDAPWLCVTCMCQVMAPCAADYRPLTELASSSSVVFRDDKPYTSCIVSVACSGGNSLRKHANYAWS
jgi:hypothetical protein